MSLLHHPDRAELLICRTNGALECFNRELNNSFPHAHPTMTDFVSTIRRISHEKFEKYERVAKGRREQAPEHHPPNLFPVSAEYTTFVYNAPAPTAARRRG